MIGREAQQKDKKILRAIRPGLKKSGN